MRFLKKSGCFFEKNEQNHSFLLKNEHFCDIRIETIFLVFAMRMRFGDSP